MFNRIVVTGATGFLGSHLLPILKRRYVEARVFGLSSRDYNLLNAGEVKQMFVDLKPDALIHLAAYSGGIGANREFPADFYYRNTLLTALVFQEAAQAGVRKMIYPMGGCSYPADAVSPIDESQMWRGFPQPESAGYSTAKMMGIVASQAYRQQYGLNSVVLIPGNMYGEYDNFHPRDSHVVPAMIRKYYEVRLTGQQEILMWGDGSPVRDFVYAGDVAAVIPWFLENYDDPGPINVSSGSRTSIKEVAETIRDLTQFTGAIKWDTTKPNGQMLKIFDTTRLRQLGLSCPTPLDEGLNRTIRWFAANYDKGSIRL